MHPFGNVLRLSRNSSRGPPLNVGTVSEWPSGSNEVLFREKVAVPGNCPVWAKLGEA